MVLEDIPQDADGVVEAAAMFDAHRFGDGDLDVIDVVAIPDRLEDAVGEAKEEDVLHRLLAQVVVDAIDLVLAQVAVQGGVELTGGLQVAAEGFLDDHAPPSVAVVDQSSASQGFDQSAIDLGRRGQIEKEVANSIPSATLRGCCAIPAATLRGCCA